MLANQRPAQRNAIKAAASSGSDGDADGGDAADGACDASGADGGVDDALAALSLSVRGGGGADADFPRVLRHLHGLRVFIVDTPARLASLLASGDLSRPPALGVDLEGVDLGAPGGEVCLVQLAGGRAGPVWLVDVHALSPAVAFDAARPSLARVLGAPGGPTKLFYDLRSDAAALARHGVALAGDALEDVQLLVVAHMLAGGRPAERLVGLGHVVDKARLAALSNAERAAAAKAKGKARALFLPELGGDFAVWRERPLRALLVEYATDARYLFSVREKVRRWKGGRFDAVLGRAVADATARRLAAALAAPPDRRDRDAMTMVDPELTADVEGALAAWREANPGR